MFSRSLQFLCSKFMKFCRNFATVLREWNILGICRFKLLPESAEMSLNLKFPKRFSFFKS